MKKIFLMAFLAAAIMLTGCSAKERPDESVTETTTSEAETTAVETETETETEKTSESEETSETEETEPDTDIPIGISAGKKIFDSISDGFITYDKSEIKRLLNDSGIAEKSLAANIKSTDTDQSIYKFAMINDESAEGVYTDGETVFCSTLYLGDEEYFVYFGTDEYSDIEDVLPYCTENKTVEYWAFAFVDEDGIILFPLIAGSEESGYYAVLPVLKSLGMDVSGMKIPDEPLGFDYDPDSKFGEAVDGDGTFTINITGAENMDGMVRADCTVINTYSFDAVISGKTLTVNGEDFSDNATVYFEVKSGETVTDEFFYIYDCALKVGDTIFIEAELIDGETYEDIGEVTFTFELE